MTKKPKKLPALATRFIEYDEANPRVWRLFKQYTMRAIRAGHEHYSADGIMHMIRWETSVKQTKAGPVSLPNNFTAMYARKFITTNPKHAEFFVTRPSVADTFPAEVFSR